MLTITAASALSTLDFFRPASEAIIYMGGTTSRVDVVVTSGYSLSYLGTGLGFSGTTPTSGTVSEIQFLFLDGLIWQQIASMTISGAGLAFTSVVSSAALVALLDQPTRITGSAQDDNFVTGEGADTITPGTGADTVLAGGGADIIRLEMPSNGGFPANAGAKTLHGEGGTDTLRLVSLAGANGALDLFGTTLNGIERLDLIEGGIAVLSGAQIAGFDRIEGHATKAGVVHVDQSGGVGLDVSGLLFGGGRLGFYLQGSDAGAALKGHGATADVLAGAGGHDRLAGLGGADTLFGDPGNDTLEGGAGNDRLLGSAGFDRLFGRVGNDWLEGGDSFDWLRGGTGNDTLRGGGGSDWLLGSAGADVLTGGAGRDVFVLRLNDSLRAAADGGDRITDFDTSGADADRLYVGALRDVSGWADLRANHLKQVGSDVVLTASGGRWVLEDVAISALNANFINVVLLG